jgi:hypothetical protein
MIDRCPRCCVIIYTERLTPNPTNNIEIKRCQFLRGICAKDNNIVGEPKIENWLSKKGRL